MDHKNDLSDEAMEKLLGVMGLGLEKSSDLKCCVCNLPIEDCTCTETEVKDFVETNISKLQKEGNYGE